jgi:subtilisin family serine protease
MKNFVALVLSLLLFRAHSQTSGMNNALRVLLDERKTTGLVCDLLVEGPIPAIAAAQAKFGYRLNYHAGNIASITCDIKTIPALLDAKVIDYAEYIRTGKKPLNDSMRVRNRIAPVKLWTAPLPQAYNGEGVIVGIMDSGIDFSHPDLKDESGKSRIISLWDQVQSSGSTVPPTFGYGIEWTNAQINNGQCTHTDFTYYGHGTHVSGIAAGNGRALGRFEGCASKADIIAVAMDFNRAGPINADAVNYIFTKATALGKPCVINASVGDYYGSHDATDLEARIIENMLKNVPGRVMVAAVGNAGASKFHVKTQPQGDTLFTWLGGSNAYQYWCYGDLQQVSNLQFCAGANRSNFSNVGRTGFKNYNYALNSVQVDTLKNSNNKRVGLVKLSASINTSSVYELYAEIIPDTANLLWRIETRGSGLQHAWNFDFVSSGLPTVAQYPFIAKYASPDTMYTMVSSFQCSEEVITVGNYYNSYGYYNFNNSFIPGGSPGGSLAQNSSGGPTRDGRIKPDIAASGNGILSCMALGLRNGLLANSPNVVAQGSMHVVGGGSSASSPVVAGLSALYLQRYPTATSRQVRDAIRHCAYTDAYTGTVVPNYVWGFGKLDGKATMYCGEGVYNGLSVSNSGSARYYPNPFGEKTTIEVDDAGNHEIRVYSMAGQLLLTDRFSGNHYALRSSSLPEDCYGLLFVSVDGLNTRYTLKLIKDQRER